MARTYDAPSRVLLVSARAMASSGSQSDNGFAERLSPLIAKLGVVAVPVLLIRHQADLGLTDGELVYLLQVLAHKWAQAWPWVAVSDVVKATGHHERNVRSRKQSVEQKGYLFCRPQWKPDGTRGGDEHDLSGLFAALERFAIAEQTKQALDDVQADFPEPRYYRGALQVAPKTEKRATLKVRRRGKAAADAARDSTHIAEVPPGDIATTPPGDIATARPAISPATPLALSPAQSETGQQKPLTPPTPQGARGIDRGQGEAVVRKPDDSFQPALPGTAAVALPRLSGHDDPAEHLLIAFYRGLDSDIASLTSRQRQAKLKLACELVAAGATPGQAEAYARETNAQHRRTAPVTLRSFAEERQAWLQRRGRVEATGPRLIDRTGQPPSWATGHAAERHDSTAGAIARAIVGGGA